MSRSSNQKRKRKTRRATGVPCVSGRRAECRAAWEAFRATHDVAMVSGRVVPYEVSLRHRDIEFIVDPRLGPHEAHLLSGTDVARIYSIGTA